MTDTDQAMNVETASSGNERLTLKWGTLKGWHFDETNEKAIALIEKYHEIGASLSAMAQRDTPEQKQIICDLIDVTNGEIWNDWDGAPMTKEDAKSYVMDYGKGGIKRSE